MLEEGNEEVDRECLRRIQMMEIRVQPQGVGNLILHDLRTEGLEDIQPLQFSGQYVPVGALHAISEEHSALDPAEPASPVFIEVSLEGFFVGLK